MIRCKNCKFYNPGHDGRDEGHACSRWRYGYNEHPLQSDSDIIVEDDEGWGADMGPEFGCVLGEPKATADHKP